MVSEALGHPRITITLDTYSHVLPNMQDEMMTAVANGLKLLTEVGAVDRRRRMFGGIVAVILVTLPASIGLILYLGYEHGAINLSSFYFNNVSQYPFRFLQTNVDTPFAANWLGWAHTAAGAMVMAALMAVQHHYLWWPFHPVGYAVSGWWIIGRLWLPLFISTILKWSILRFGGVGAYRKTIPFFQGLILGDFVLGSCWSIIGILFEIPSYVFWGG